MSASLCILVACPACDHEFEVDVTLPTPETGRWGPPENYDPGDGGEIVPDCCPKCGKELDDGLVMEQAGEEWRDRQDEAAEARYDAMRENQMFAKE